MKLTKGERAIFLQVLNVKIQQGSVFMLGDGTTTDDVERERQEELARQANEKKKKSAHVGDDSWLPDFVPQRCRLLLGCEINIS